MKFNVEKLIKKFNFKVINNPFDANNFKDIEIEIKGNLPALYALQSFVKAKDMSITFGTNDLKAIEESKEYKDLIERIPNNAEQPSLIIFSTDVDKNNIEYKRLIEYFVANKLLVLESNLSINELYSVWDPYIIRKTNFRERVHGVLISIYGIGVLITGESGIGKSEIALDLIKNNHLFVGDDAIDIFQYADKIIGKAPPTIRPFLEVRGVGIININKTFGIQRTKTSSEIDLVANLVHIDKYDDSERLNINEKKYTFQLGNELPMIDIPVSSGRSTASIIEAAVANFREKTENGYNSLNDMEERIGQK